MNQYFDKLKNCNPEHYLSNGVTNLLNKQINTFISYQSIIKNDKLQWDDIYNYISNDIIDIIINFEIKDENENNYGKYEFTFVSNLIHYIIIDCKNRIFDNSYKIPYNINECILLTYKIDIQHIIKILKESLNNIILYGILSCLISLIERILIDRILYQYPDSNPPRVLKEILKSKECMLILQPIQIVILKSILGPPISMNIRNILWHGFWNPLDNINLLINILCFFIFIIIDLCSFFNNISVSPSLIENTLDNEMFNFGLNSYCLSSISSINTKEFINDINIILNNSLFTIISRKHICLDIIQQSIYLLQNNNSIKYYGIPNILLLLSILLPNFELHLRRLFVVINDLPLELLFAHSSIYYTTIDMFIKNTYIHDEKWNPECNINNTKQPNKIISVLGDIFSIYLSDIFIFPNGPRIRDRLAHFEWNPLSINLINIDKIISFWIWLLLQFLEDKDKIYKECSISSIKIFNQIELYFSSYKCCFHPSILLEKDIRTNTYKLLELINIINNDRNKYKIDNQTMLEGEEDLYDCLQRKIVHILPFNNNIITLYKQYIKIHTKFSSDLDLTKEELQNLYSLFPIKVINYSKIESNRVTLLYQIIQSINKIINILYNKWNNYKENILNQKVSKRQIKAFIKLHANINDYIIAIQLIILCTEDNLRIIGTNSKSNIECTQQPLSLKIVRKILASTEKIHSKLINHKWDEVLLYFKTNIYSILLNRCK